MNDWRVFPVLDEGETATGLIALRPPLPVAEEYELTPQEARTLAGSLRVAAADIDGLPPTPPVASPGEGSPRSA